MPKYYSQHGEDAVLWSLFQDRVEPGYFVEVGALDGLRFSNTYSFERAGWKGICIEAHINYFEILKQNRQNSICVHAAVSDENKSSVPFYANSRGSLSTLDSSQEAIFRKNYGKYFTGFEMQNVPMVTLDKVLRDASAPIPIDIISIDVEGVELQVLQGFSIKKYQPRILVIEANSEADQNRLEQFMKEKGYFFARKLGGNVFYCQKESDVQVLQSAASHVDLIHTRHPLDSLSIHKTEKWIRQGKRYLNTFKRLVKKHS